MLVCVMNVKAVYANRWVSVMNVKAVYAGLCDECEGSIC